MDTTTNSKIQYNGIILLTAYLQRIYVEETIYVRIEQTNTSRLELTKTLLDDTYMIQGMFEQTKALTEGQTKKLASITQHMQQLMRGYFKESAPSTTDKIAIVGSSLYGEQTMNNGILRLGELFDEEINKDFHMRKKLYEDRIKVIDGIVHMFTNKKEIEENLLKPIDKWYADICNQQQYILSDTMKIGEMIGFE